MAGRPYAIYDVFTSSRLSGNPLAVVFDSSDLSTNEMQAIAREFNLSETVFISTPVNALHSAALRIFMPSGELPFAGHPTVGAAIAIVLFLVAATFIVPYLVSQYRQRRRG